mmetsp:Transcript_60476/g.168953  ORF Transcript_60476/g.168953 Transcript_60476/m.168953 type:complete len:250 (-) Transcript_60476:227-976(-)
MMKDTRLFASQSSFAHLSPEEVRKVCYRTQAMSSFPGRTPTQEVMGENFADIHAIGQRDSKYMGFQLKKAPALNRLACRHTQDFVPHPLGDNIVNKALAENFKGGLRTNQGGTPGALDTSSLYEDSFQNRTASDMKKAISRNMKPPQALTNTVAPPGKLMETKSLYHTDFIRRNVNFATKPAAPPVPGLYIGGAAQGVRSKTTNSRLHSWEAAQPFRSSSTPNIGMRPLSPMDSEILTRPRVSYMEASE